MWLCSLAGAIPAGCSIYVGDEQYAISDINYGCILIAERVLSRWYKDNRRSD
jgi:hypothetical protein